MKESEIQSQIVKLLTSHDYLVIKLIQTNANGIPDLMALKNGTTTFIEVKRPGQKPRPLQAYRHEQLRKKGFTVITATSLKEVIHLCPPSSKQAPTT